VNLSSTRTDLHCHYLPGVDDGVRSFEEGVALCRGLRQLGYTRVAATPHIRTGMFDNRSADLRERFREFARASQDLDGMPELLLGAEHFCDDVFWNLFERGDVLPYGSDVVASPEERAPPRPRGLLLELPPERLPLQLGERCFRMHVRGVRTVLAHPERYAPLFTTTEPIERLLEMGVLPLLDLMSLCGKYGRRPKQAAERMLEEGAYYAACSDCHKPQDVEVVADAIERLRELLGAEPAEELLATRTDGILRGELES
jgi:protein-tyrosine phosphatase